MRFGNRISLFLTLVLVLLVAMASAVAPMKRVIISYSNDTPQSVVDQAMREIEKAGGKITHKYNIIKGFACDAPATVLEKVEVMDAKHKATVEEDGVVTTQDD